MKALVTGGAGYIGSHTVLALLDAGHEVTVVDDLSTGHLDAVDSRAKTFDSHSFNDVTKFDQMRDVIGREQPDVILHFAGCIRVEESVRDPKKYWRTNLGGSLALLDALVSQRASWSKPVAFVFSSTAAVYDASDRPIAESHATRPLSAYGASKLAIEHALASYGPAYGIPWMALRYFNAAGANTKADLSERHDPETHLIPNLLDVAAGKHSTFTLHGTNHPTLDGTAVRDFVHVDDLAHAHVLAAQRLYRLGAQASTTLNLGAGKGHSVREVIAAAREVTGREIAVVEGPRREGDPAFLVADPRRAIEVLGWKAAKSELRTILGDAWEMRQREHVR